MLQELGGPAEVFVRRRRAATRSKPALELRRQTLVLESFSLSNQLQDLGWENLDPEVCKKRTELQFDLDRKRAEIFDVECAMRKCDQEIAHCGTEIDRIMRSEASEYRRNTKPVTKANCQSPSAGGANLRQAMAAKRNAEEQLLQAYKRLSKARGQFAVDNSCSAAGELQSALEHYNKCLRHSLDCDRAQFEAEQNFAAH